MAEKGGHPGTTAEAMMPAQADRKQQVASRPCLDKEMPAWIWKGPRLRVPGAKGNILPGPEGSSRIVSRGTSTETTLNGD